jgi:hypothetical protein
MKYEVRIEVPTYYTLNVEARDEKEARSKAWDLFDGVGIPDDIADAEIVGVRECA